MADEAPAATPAEMPEQTAPAKGDKPTIAVKVYAPFKVYFEGDAHSISAVNEVGPFDILPKHRNFLTMLLPCTINIQTPGGQKDVKVTRALMHVKSDRVVVFMDV